MKRELTIEQFLKDVSDHKMEVIQDNGIHRHLRFSDGSSILHFNIVTWPGYLAIAGDMGAYVFSRLQDMFEFFATENYAHIDFRYWAEKARAADKDDGIMEYSEEMFREAIATYLDNVEASAEIRSAVNDEILCRASDGQHEAMRAAYEFNYKGWQFEDVGELSVQKYTNRFIWNCYAIAWGINQYNAMRKAESVAVAQEVVVVEDSGKAKAAA